MRSFRVISSLLLEASVETLIGMDCGVDGCSYTRLTSVEGVNGRLKVQWTRCIADEDSRR